MALQKRGLLGPAAGVLVLCGTLAVSAPAFSQNATDQTAQNAATAGTLQEVVVTAEKRSENIQTTSISIVAISGADLTTNNIGSVDQLQQVTPDMTVQSGGTNESISIRGVGLQGGAADAEGGVIILRDGVPNVTAGVGLDEPYYDMADVEILRGPQGTFEGDNSTGGAVVVTSADPNFRGLNGFVTGKVGTYSDYGLQGAVNLPISDTLAMRLAFNEEERGSFFYDEGSAVDGPNEAGGNSVATGQPFFDPYSPTCKASCASYPVTDKTGIDPGNVDDKDMRLGLLWKPTDWLQSLTKIEIDVSDSDGLTNQVNTQTFAPPAGQPCPANEGTAPNCHSRYLSGYSGNPYVINSWLSGEKYDEPINSYIENLQFTLPDGIELRAIGSDEEIGQYELTNGTNNSLDYQNGQPDTSIDQTHDYSGEVDLISPTGHTLSWIVGASWFYSAAQYGSFSQSTYPPNSDTNPFYSYWADGETIYSRGEGIYGQLTWQIDPALQFQIGGREGFDDNYGVGEIALDFGPPLGTIFSYNAFPYKDHAVPTGKVGLNWTPVQGQYFYVFAARGYKPGLANLGNTPPAEKEWDNDYELGWKGTMAGGHVQTQLGGYYMQYYNMQESIFEPNNASSSAYGNIGSPSTIKGIEASLQTQLGGFGFNVGLAYNKSTLGSLVDYRNYAFPPGFGRTNQCLGSEVPTPSNPGTNCTDYSAYRAVLSGEPLPYAPLFSGNASIQYAIPLGSMILEPRVTYSYIAKSYASLYDINYNLLPSHSLVNAYLDWVAGPWTTTLYSTNVANAVYLTAIGYYSAPRQVGLMVNRTF